MEKNFFDYINNIRQNKINEINYVNSLSEEVLNIIKESEESNSTNSAICSIKLIPFLEKYITFNTKEENENENKNKNKNKDTIENNIIIQSNKEYSILNHSEFSNEIDLTTKIKVETIRPYITKILSLKFNNFEINVNKLNFSLLITSLIENILVSIHKSNSNKVIPRTLSEILILVASQKILPIGIINLCITLIGPPTSINLRNLLWHGFLNDEQLSNTLFCSLILLYQT